MYISDPKKKDEEASFNTSGVVDAVGSSAPAPGSAQAEQSQKTPGTGYVNLQSYLDLNKGAGAGLASKANEGALKAADQFKSSAQSSLDQSQQKFTDASGASQAGALKGAILQDANKTKGAAMDFLGSGYSGPTAGDYTASLAADKSKVQQSLESAGDPSQQQANLQQAYGQGGKAYTSGYGLLDSFLMQGDESGRQKIGEIKGMSSDIGATYDQTAKTLSEREKQAREGLQANKQAIVDTAIGKKDTIESEAKRVADQKNRQNSGNQDFRAASLGDALTDSQGIELQALREIANLDPGDYARTFNQGTPGSSPGGVSPADRAAGKTVAAEKAATAERVNTPSIVGSGPSADIVFKPTGPRYDEYGNPIYADTLTAKQQVEQLGGIPMIPIDGPGSPGWIPPNYNPPPMKPKGGGSSKAKQKHTK